MLVEFAGGLEALFSDTKQLDLVLPPRSATTIADLIARLAADHLSERPELFLSGSTV